MVSNTYAQLFYLANIGISGISLKIIIRKQNFVKLTFKFNSLNTFALSKFGRIDMLNN